MNDLTLYFDLGFRHIVSWNALDHILFICALCVGYQFYEWKKILFLITAFTLGHCLTLVLSSYNIISFDSAITEFLIAITILITALYNCMVVDKRSSVKKIPVYVFSLLFGMVHGLGFAFQLKSLLGKTENIVTKLFAFNIGIELAQILIVIAFLFVTYAFISILHVEYKSWILFVNGIIFGLAFNMAFERNPLKKENEISDFFLPDNDGPQHVRSIAELQQPTDESWQSL